MQGLQWLLAVCCAVESGPGVSKGCCTDGMNQMARGRRSVACAAIVCRDSPASGEVQRLLPTTSQQPLELRVSVACQLCSACMWCACSQ